MEAFEFDERYLNRLRNGDQATAQHFVGYFGELLLIKARDQGLAGEVAEVLRGIALWRVITTLRWGTSLQPKRFVALASGICDKVIHDYHRWADQVDAFRKAEGEGAAPSLLQLLRETFFIEVVITLIAFVLRELLRKNDEAVTRSPGLSLLLLTESFCSKKTTEEIAKPAIADMQFEYYKAVSEGRKYGAVWVRVRGTWSLFMALSLRRLVRLATGIFLRFMTW